MTRKRAVLRLLAFAVEHSAAVCALLYILGALGVLLAPLLARNVFTDENSLLVGASASRLDSGFSRACLNSAQAASKLVQKSEHSQRLLTDWLLRELLASGLTAHAHSFVAEEQHRLRGRSGTANGTNVVAIARAARGDGKEALVIMTPLHGDSALAVSVGLHLMSHLARAPWLSRDIIWLVADDGVVGGAYAAVEAWLADYRGDEVARRLSSMHAPDTATFLRSGSISAAIAFDIPAVGFDELELQVQGTHGALPNLDVVSVISHSALGVPLRVAGLSNDRIQLGYSASMNEYAASLRAGAQFLGRQLCCTPVSLHGAFIDGSIDSASVVGIQRSAAMPTFRDEHVVMTAGRILEAALHCWSNILERLHHSSAFYILLGPSRLIQAPGFLPQGGILITALVLQACTLALRGSGLQWSEAPGTAEWSHAIVALVCALSACGVSHQMLVRMPTGDNGAAALWAACASVACYAGLRIPDVLDGEPKSSSKWLALKALMLISLALWLARALVQCYAISLAGALALAPMCLVARPSAAGEGKALRSARWSLLLAASPPVVLHALRALFGSKTLTATLQLLVEEEQQWGTLLLTFLLGAYLPCFLVCSALLST